MILNIADLERRDMQQALPPSRAEPDPVIVAETRVAEKWHEVDELDTRRVETGADVVSDMQRALQDGLNITSEIFNDITNRVIAEVKAGGLRGRIGNRALPHVEDALAAMNAVIESSSQASQWQTTMDKISAVFSPLRLAYNCLTSQQSELAAPDATPQPLPAKHALPDPVAVAEARVVEKWDEMEQLNSSRIENVADVQDDMRRTLQETLNITMEIVDKVSTQVIAEVKAGGQRGRIGNRALPHVRDALALTEAVSVSNSRGDWRETMATTSAVFGPLRLAYDCLAAASR